MGSQEAPAPQGSSLRSPVDDERVVPPIGDVDSPESVRAALREFDYIADMGMSTALFLALTLGKPLFLEGEPGAGKTELAQAIVRWTAAPLFRLQCYEGIDTGQAIYEWDYARQLLHLRAAEAGGRRDPASLEDELYAEQFLVRRPLLKAITEARSGSPRPVLLIDEVDRADDEFEALLLEALSDYTVSVPELGTFRAEVAPTVILTSNRTRDVHDALKRRCLYHWVEHPDLERELAIVRMRVPDIDVRLAHQVTAAVRTIRTMGLYKPPGVAETIDWSRALAALGTTELDEDTIVRTLGAVIKHREDTERVTEADVLRTLTASSDPPDLRTSAHGVS